MLIRMLLLAMLVHAGDMPNRAAHNADCPPQFSFQRLADLAHHLIEHVLAATSAPRTREIRLPKLLTGNLVTREQVCEDARRSNPGKRVALVVIKTHICDHESGVCLKTTRDISDPCNKFIQSNFAVYHTRMYRVPPGSHEMVEDPANDALEKAWSDPKVEWGGPTFVFVDLRSCTRIGSIGPGLPGIGGDHMPPAPVRYRMLQQATMKIPAVRALLPRGAGAPLSHRDLSCFQRGAEPSLDQITNALDRAQPLY